MANKEILTVHEKNPGQVKLMELLKKFDALCRKHDITYYLGGGTALGAVRHRGLLPWDDDVDLYITQGEYRKLLAVQDEIFDESFVLANNENYSRYFNTYARCIDTSTTAITTTRVADDAPKGQFLELFIMIPIPEEGPEREAWLAKWLLYCELMTVTFRCVTERNYRYMDYDKLAEYRKRMEIEGRDVVIAELESELFYVDESTATDYILSWGLDFFIYARRWFAEPRYVPFEDTVMPVAKYAESIFRAAYGDKWMYVPKVDSQIVHNVTVNMDVAYSDFMAKALPEIDMDELWNMYPARKEAIVERFRLITERDRSVRKVKSVMVRESLKRNVPLEVLEAMTARGDYAGIESAMKVWFDNQMSPVFWKWHECLDAGEAYLYYAFMAMLMKGDFNKVLRLVKDLRTSGTEISDRIADLEQYGLLLRNLYVYLDYSHYDYLESHIDDLKAHKYYAKQYDYLYLKLTLARRKLTKENAVPFMDAVSSVMELFPQSGELLSYLADAQLLAGYREAAQDTYVEAYNKTRHGFIRMHIEDTLRKMEVTE